MRWLRRTPVGAARWAAIDCETSGLDPARERLLSVGMLGVADGRIDLSASFHAMVRQRMPSEVDNILIHGIGGDAQLAGLPVDQVIQGLAARV